MAQSNDSNVRGTPPFWPNHTLEPSHAWTQWSDQFQLAIIAKEYLDLEPTWTRDTGDANSNFGTSNRQRVGRGKSQQREQEQKHNETVRIGSEGKRVFTQKNPRVKILAISFSEFWTLLDAEFNKPPNTTFERYKLLNLKQKYRESYEQFWGALTDLDSTCNIKESDEAEWIRDIFICNMKNTATQRKLLSATINPSEALNQALIDKKGYFNHQKLTNMSRSSTNGTTFKSFSNHNHIKRNQV